MLGNLPPFAADATDILQVLDVQRAAWPTEDYHLARSLVDTELPEDDLFTGVLESVTL